LVNESVRRIFSSRHPSVLVPLTKDLSRIEINGELSNKCALIVSFAPSRSITFLDAFVMSAYSAYARGLDAFWNMYQWLDRAPLGRNETGLWFRRHDEYDSHPHKADSCCHSGQA
jgi:hypothetical protein